MELSNLPYKGTADWMPDEFSFRKAIFDVWRDVCRSYGYEEYMTPLVEPIEIYKAKSGEDLGGKELMRITDRAGRELAIRPEMTPSVTRMISRNYEGMSKPIRLFSIANFMRAEKPQRGRNREFWQLNYDIFGSESSGADLEILLMALEIMLSFDPPENAFTLKVNNRKIISDFAGSVLNINKEREVELMRVMDKYDKVSKDEFKNSVKKISSKEDSLSQIEKFMNSNEDKTLRQNFPKLEDSESFKEMEVIMSGLESSGYPNWVEFKPNVIRGLDYYDGMVFEVFDNNPKNNRSLFGGGRYNGLADIFGSSNIPAVGCAPGDEPIRLFLESWDLLRKLDKNDYEKIFVPLLDKELSLQTRRVSTMLRSKGASVETGIEVTRVGKALTYADKKGFDKVVLIGEEEASKNYISIKDLKTGNQTKEDVQF